MSVDGVDGLAICCFALTLSPSPTLVGEGSGEPSVEVSHSNPINGCAQSNILSVTQWLWAGGKPAGTLVLSVPTGGGSGVDRTSIQNNPDRWVGNPVLKGRARVTKPAARADGLTPRSPPYPRGGRGGALGCRYRHALNRMRRLPLSRNAGEGRVNRRSAKSSAISTLMRSVRP